MKQKKFEICCDHDNVDISDWIQSHFANGNWNKKFEITVTIKEIDYDEDGKTIYIDKN